MNSVSENNCFVGGFLIGSLLGACLAALLAPYKGDQAQSNISEFYKTGLDKAKGLQEQTKSSINEFKDLTQEKAKRLVGDLQNKAENIASRFDNITAKGASVLIDDEIV